MTVYETALKWIDYVKENYSTKDYIEVGESKLLVYDVKLWTTYNTQNTRGVYFQRGHLHTNTEILDAKQSKILLTKLSDLKFYFEDKLLKDINSLMNE